VDYSCNNRGHLNTILEALNMLFILLVERGFVVVTVLSRILDKLNIKGI
jgi:hypothetical protein